MNNKGFFLLEGLAAFTLGITLLITCLRTYHTCLATLQKKLLLEEAISAADLYLAQQSSTTKMDIKEVDTATGIEGLTLKEVQVSYEGTLIFTLTVAP